MLISTVFVVISHIGCPRVAGVSKRIVNNKASLDICIDCSVMSIIKIFIQV